MPSWQVQFDFFGSVEFVSTAVEEVVRGFGTPVKRTYRIIRFIFTTVKEYIQIPYLYGSFNH